jgi:hypothetical protein
MEVNKRGMTKICIDSGRLCLCVHNKRRAREGNQIHPKGRTDETSNWQRTSKVKKIQPFPPFV